MLESFMRGGVVIFLQMILISFIFLFSTTKANNIADELYYVMPPLFHLDDYDGCLQNHGVFCLGTFHLTVPKNNEEIPTLSKNLNYRGKELYHILQAFTSQRHRFNHTLLHRGLCLSKSCAGSREVIPRKRFQECVNGLTRTDYGLAASLLRLDYCKSQQTQRPIPLDDVDLGFLAICFILLVANILGTAYDLFRKKETKGYDSSYMASVIRSHNFTIVSNELLLSWSLIKNFQKFLYTYPNDDSLVSRFNPIHGMKSLTLIMVLVVHSVLVNHLSYLYNPNFLETRRQSPAAMILHNGSISLQAFILLSSFLFTHNFQILENRDKMSSIKLFFAMLLRRVARILPLYMFMVGFTATWSRFIGDGTLWIPVMEKEAQMCRLKWWSQALFIQNLYRTDDRCLIQTWFLAVDMQLYTMAILIALALSRCPRTAVKVLLALFITSVISIFAVAYVYDLKAMVFYTDPEYVRNLYVGVPSFYWSYTSPWCNLPASLLGIMLGFLYYNMREDKVDLHQYFWFKIMYRISLPLLLIWIYCGYLLPLEPSRIVSSAYAAIDRPVYAITFSVFLMGSIYRIDRIWWQFMSWRGWQILGKMSLCILMTHWTFDLIQISLHTNTSKMSIFEIGGHLFVTMFMTLVTSVPLHVMVEKPIQVFIRASLKI